MPSHVEKVAAIADLPQDAASNFADVGLFTPVNTVERSREKFRKRSTTVKNVMGVLINSTLMTERGRIDLAPFNGEVMTPKKE